MTESAITFCCHNSELLGIVNTDPGHGDTAVLIVVGGPQYRVGSHRQFVQLARSLAESGISSLRFDYRGMGDSEGDKQSFEDVCDDIAAACDVLQETVGCKNIVIWGLCDAASAAMIYAHKDNRICGLILLNPWLRSEQAMGKTMLKHYYLQRLMSKEFWSKLLRGNVNVKGSLSEVASYTQDSVSKQDDVDDSYQKRMQKGLGHFNGKLCMILSGVDLTAREFDEQTKGAKAWKRLTTNNVEVHRFEKADHTFSNSKFKLEVENISADFVNSSS
jgi:exosortase A-associated hydrolase 1